VDLLSQMLLSAASHEIIDIRRSVAKVVSIALLVSNIAIITGKCPESPCKYRSCWPGEWRHSLKIQWLAAIKLAMVAV
jgi:hypothetical protein